jgi:hypothetical protein
MANDPFAPPPEDKRPLAPIEIEKEWGEEKAKRQATAVVHGRAAGRSKAWIWAVIGVVVAGVIAVGVVVQMHAKPKDNYGTLPETPGKVRIEIRANPKAMIKIDGKKAGATPLSLYVTKSTTPVQIDNGKQIKSVIPDHDQLVDFTR